MPSAVLSSKISSNIGKDGALHTYATTKLVAPLGIETLSLPEVNDWAANAPDPTFKATAAGVPFVNDRETWVAVPPPPPPPEVLLLSAPPPHPAIDPTAQQRNPEQPSALF